MPHNYGLISDIDAIAIELYLDNVMEQFPGDDIHVAEIGIYNGRTSRGIKEYIESKGRQCVYIGVDNFKDNEKPVFFPAGATLLNGNSNEVYWKVENESQHFIFIDGCHCFAHVVSDYYCWRNKVKRGGYFAFHDTGKHIKPFKDFQHGDPENPDAYISVRKALLGIVDFNMRKHEVTQDTSDEAGGITIYQRISA